MIVLIAAASSANVAEGDQDEQSTAAPASTSSSAAGTEVTTPVPKRSACSPGSGSIGVAIIGLPSTPASQPPSDQLPPQGWLPHRRGDAPSTSAPATASFTTGC